jgi:hypothetical protein
MAGMMAGSSLGSQLGGFVSGGNNANADVSGYSDPRSMNDYGAYPTSYNIKDDPFADFNTY